MIKDSDSTQSNKPISSETVVTPLKLVVSNVLPVPEKLIPLSRETKTGFTAEVRQRSPYMYALVARDPFHYLDCTFPLETETDSSGSAAVTCRFPLIDDGALNDFIEEDETLLGMIHIQFQMKVMEQLLLFCVAHKAPTLRLQVSEAQSKGMGIYSGLVVHEDELPGGLIRLTIPAHTQALEMWAGLMEEVRETFRQTLWQEQKENPIIRHYLKSNPWLSIVH